MPSPCKGIRFDFIATYVDQCHLRVCRDLFLVFLQQLWSVYSAGASSASTKIEEIIPGRLGQICLNVIAPDEVICQAKKLAAERLRLESGDDFRGRCRRALLQSLGRARTERRLCLFAGDKHHEACHAHEEQAPPTDGMKRQGIQGHGGGEHE